MSHDVDNEFDIAIVGMAGRFPGARNLDEFWRNLADGVESIARFSDDELLASGVPASRLADPAYVKAAPVLEEPGRFDAGFFGYSPLEARTMDPQHRLLLELAHEALEHAGCDPERYPGRIGVFAGAAFNTYFMNTALASRFVEDYIPTLIGSDKDFLSTRICYKLNLKGPGITVQTACSTSLVAVHLARQSLLGRETDMALAGAASVRVPHRAGYLYDGGGVVSPDGRVRAFDARANGTVFGSGGGVVVLKRLQDAIADGDTVHAVIKGSAVNNDGAEKAGYTAPGVASQADAVIEALANAGIDADSVSYVEAHGSGTPVGDPIEVRALTRAFRASTQRSGYCAIGSVKTNVGHLDAAAAAAGLIKTVLALEHRQLPPSLHFEEPNPEIDFPATPFYVNTRLAPWTSDGPRRAGVMSTGMGGTNAHVVLEEAPAPAAASAARPPHLLVLSARTETALEGATQRLRQFLEAHPDVDLGDAAYTLQAGRKALEHRRCLVCDGHEDALAALREKSPRRLLAGGGADARRPVILLLPGIGDHYVGMGHGLYERWPQFRDEVDRCAQVFAPHLGLDIRSVVYPASRGWQKTGAAKGMDLRKMLDRSGDALEAPDAQVLNLTRLAQPALFTIEYATARLWQSLGIVPDAMAGHSMGEYVAACLAGVLSLEDAARLIAVRARLVDELPRGAMLAVMLPEDELQALLPDELAISLINGPGLCVVAGSVADVDAFERKLSERGVVCRRVRNAHPFHSPLLEPIAKAFEAEVRQVRLGMPAIPFISNVTGTWITPEQAADPAYWVRHATRTARFGDALRQVWQFRNPVLLEAGPGRTLGVLAMQHPARRAAGEPVAIASIRHDFNGQPDADFLWQAIGRLWLAGARIDWDSAHGGRRLRRIPLPTYPFEGQNHWLEPACSEAPRTVARNEPDSARWLYAPSWRRLLPLNAGRDEIQGDGTRTWLVFTHDAFPPVLIETLRSAGQRVITVKAGAAFERTNADAFHIDAGNPRHYDSLVRALQDAPPDRIVHAWSVGETGTAAGRPFDEAQARGFYSLVFLAKALAACHAGREMHLCALSSGVQDVCGTEILSPEKSTLLGPCMAIRQEYPNIRTQSIDLDLRPGCEAAVALVLGEIRETDPELFVAHRNGQRWLRSYEAVTLEPPRSGRAPFRACGVYLITGGLGRIGSVISEYLAANYRARLVLVGRASEPGAGSREAIERIEKLGGEVLYASADVADASAMRRVIAGAHERFGALHGVIHGAGIVGDAGYGEIKDCTQAGCDAHFQAKAHGALVLEEVLEGEALDFCLLLSSLTSVLGGIGQAAYASSNIFLDTIVRRHNRAASVPWLSVNWDVWRIDERADDSGLGATLKEFGMSAAQATAVLETVLAARGAGQLVVSTGDLAARIDQWIRMAPSREGATARRARAASAEPSRTAPRPGADLPRDEAESQVARAWQEALGLDEVGIHDNFGRLGGHSLLAVRIVTHLRKAFQVDLPVRALFDAPTVAELARYVKERIAAEIDALSDEEAQRLVSSG